MFNLALAQSRRHALCQLNVRHWFYQYVDAVGVCLTNRTLSFTVNLRNGKIGRKCQIRHYAPLVSPTSSAAQYSTCYTATCCGLDRPYLVRSYKAKIQISVSLIIFLRINRPNFVHFISDVVLETRVLVSRRLGLGSSSLGLGLEHLVLVSFLKKKSCSFQDFCW